MRTMANPFFSALGGGMMGGMNPNALLSQLQTNPLGVLRRAGYNVPDNVSNPQAIIQHLMNSGQISQQQLNSAQIMAQTFGVK